MKILGYLLLASLMVSCGESPLLNHSTEQGSQYNKADQPVAAEGNKFVNSKFSFSVDWTEGPSKGESKFILKSWSDKLGTINGPYQNLPEVLNVYLWMPDMGHGSAPVKIKKLDQGEYEVSGIYFIMSGKWELHFQILNNNKVVDEVILPITL